MDKGANMKKWLMATAVAGFTFGCVTAQQAVKEEEPITCEAWAGSMLGNCRVLSSTAEGEPASAAIAARCEGVGGELMLLILHPTALRFIVQAKSIGYVEGPSCREQGVDYRTFSKEFEQ